MWFTQLGLDRGRGRLSGISMHVSPIESHTVFQITHAGNRPRFFTARPRRIRSGDWCRCSQGENRQEGPRKFKSSSSKQAKRMPKSRQLSLYIVPGTTLYASSDSGMVHALDGETGRTLWTTQIGNPLYPTSTPSGNDKHVGVCNGSTLYVLLVEDGSVVGLAPRVALRSWPGAVRGIHFPPDGDRPGGIVSDRRSRAGQPAFIIVWPTDGPTRCVVQQRCLAHGQRESLYVGLYGIHRAAVSHAGHRCDQLAPRVSRAR